MCDRYPDAVVLLEEIPTHSESEHVRELRPARRVTKVVMGAVLFIGAAILTMSFLRHGPTGGGRSRSDAGSVQDVQVEDQPIAVPIVVPPKTLDSPRSSVSESEFQEQMHPTPLPLTQREYFEKKLKDIQDSQERQKARLHEMRDHSQSVLESQMVNNKIIQKRDAFIKAKIDSLPASASNKDRHASEEEQLEKIVDKATLQAVPGDSRPDAASGHMIDATHEDRSPTPPHPVEYMKGDVITETGDLGDSERYVEMIAAKLQRDPALHVPHSALSLEDFKIAVKDPLHLRYTTTTLAPLDQQVGSAMASLLIQGDKDVAALNARHHDDALHQLRQKFVDQAEAEIATGEAKEEEAMAEEDALGGKGRSGKGRMVGTTSAMPSVWVGR